MSESPRIPSSGPQVLDAAATRAGLGFDRLIPALRQAFASGASVPPRHHHEIVQQGAVRGTLLLMPAWQDGFLGMKMVTIYPENGAVGLPAVNGTYLLCDGATGVPRALIDGDQLTARRTAAVAALAANCLASSDAETLLILGAGRVASLAEAFGTVRPIRRVLVWNRKPAGAERLATQLRDSGFDAVGVDDLEAAARAADIVHCATLSTVPLIDGAWLRPGTHLDLVGSFNREMREAADTCFAGTRVFVDTIDALAETGDLISPIEAGLLNPGSVRTLADLCAGREQGRVSDSDITIFKAVGTALADLAAAVTAFDASR